MQVAIEVESRIERDKCLFETLQEALEASFTNRYCRIPYLKGYESISALLFLIVIRVSLTAYSY